MALLSTHNLPPDTKMSRLLFALTMLCAWTGPARAAFVTGLYNTGVDNAGNLAADRSADLHYTLISGADKALSFPRSAIIADSSRFPFVPDGWLPEGPLSKWIDPIADQNLGNPPGDYVYQTTFQIVGTDPTSVTISGKWTLDNIGKDILVNGHSTGIYYQAPGDYSFKAYQSFVLPSTYFVEGTNTLTFVVNNSDNGNGNTPTGLRVEFVVTASPTPAPSSWILLASGILGLGLAHCLRTTFQRL